MYVTRIWHVNLKWHQLITWSVLADNPTTSSPWLSPFHRRAFITWLANGDTVRIFKMMKKDDGTLSFKAAAEDFPQKHKATILNIGIAETGTERAFNSHVKL